MSRESKKTEGCPGGETSCPEEELERQTDTETFLNRELLQSRIEEALCALPVVQYAWMKTSDLVFSEKVRTICREECPRYGTSWSCPPGVGSVSECRSACEAYESMLVFTTVAEVMDAANLSETLATRSAHEEVTRHLQALLGKWCGKTLALSAESCAICRHCSYPDGPCRHPERMLPCIEGYGILVPPVAEKAGIEFMNEGGVVTWFGMILF